LVGHAEDVTLDGSGRLLVSNVLREFAGLKKEVMFVGQGTHFELWSAEAWHKQNKVIEGDVFEMPPELEGLSL
jgi:MraZ protein